MNANLYRLGFCASLLISAASCSSNSPASPSPAPGAHAVVVLGHSPWRRRRRPLRIFRPAPRPRVVAEVAGSTMTNSSFPGDTTQAGLSRFDSSVPAGTTLLVLELGANDGLQGVPIATIEQNLSTMIERAQSRGMRVLLCGMEAFPTYGVDYSAAFHDTFPRRRQGMEFRSCRFSSRAWC